MASTRRKQGTMEFGDIYDEVRNPDGSIRRGVKLGRLVIDFDKEDFWLRRPDKTSMRYSQEEIGYLLANELIAFDQPDMGSNLTQYLMRLEKRTKTIQEAEVVAIKNRQAIEEMQEDTILRKRIRKNTILAKLIWVCGCACMVLLAFIATIPTASPAPAVPSIAGEGQDYGVSSELAASSSYIETLGSGSDLYGVILDTDIVEVGNQLSGESTIKENVLVNTAISSQPIHMRPLHYDKSTFYQSMLSVNDDTDSSTAVFLQNPSGYANTQVPANELVITGGAGLSQFIIQTPTDISDTSASTAQKELEQKAKSASTSSSNQDYSASEMPEGWSGFESCDIDGNIVVASFWYTPENTQSKSDLKRRIAVFDVSALLSGTIDDASDIEAIQMNYQDMSSSYYSPVVSASPAANKQAYWIAYTKSTVDGTTGFYIRKYERNEDVINEDYTNTFTTQDITGSSTEILNYTLYGDKLFYEQSGAIWAIDLSKITVSIDGAVRTVHRENPVQICKTSEMSAYATRDEQFRAKVLGEALQYTSHYKVMTITTDSGVEYGIAFIESDTGNLVYQPCVSLTTAAESVNSGLGEDSSDTLENSNSSNLSQQSSTKAFTLKQTANSSGSQSNNGRILIRAGQSNNINITAFTIRGEQLVWIEKNAEGTAKVMFSPVYYKNEASQVESEPVEEQNNTPSETTSAINVSNNANASNDNATNTSDAVTVAPDSVSNSAGGFKEL